MRKRSKSKATLDKADRQVQDYYRAKFPKGRCESCGRLFSLIHHFIEKSKSNYLRFNIINFIFICKKCHSLHHCFGDSSIHARIILHKGEKWLEEIIKASRIKRESFSKGELEKIIKLWTI